MGQTELPKIIVLVPVRNEAWILRPFLECASRWADHIIIADQLSDDGSRELAAAYPKVTVIDNPQSGYSEVERQRLLISAARRIPGPRLLIAIDADEFVSANVVVSPQWQEAIRQPPGTLLKFAKVEMSGSGERYFLHSVEDKNNWIPFGYVDDGAEHDGSVIHTCRVPEREGAPSFRLSDVVVLHFARLNAARAESKDRWYRCFERVSFPEKNVLTIHRLYDWYERLEQTFDFRAARPEWFGGYRRAGVDLGGRESEAVFWWDWDVLRMFDRHGTSPFRYLDIWAFDWESLRQEGISRGVRGLPAKPVLTPGGLKDRLIRAALKCRRSRGLVNRVLWRMFRYGLI